jgi:hypothetical protein
MLSGAKFRGANVRERLLIFLAWRNRSLTVAPR